MNFSLIINEKNLSTTFWKPNDCDDFAPLMFMQEKNGNETGGPGIEMDTKDSTEKNVGSNEESENEQPLLRNTNSIQSDPENPDILNTTNEA